MYQIKLGGASGRTVTLRKSESMVAIRTNTRGAIRRSDLDSTARSALRETRTAMTFEGEDIVLLTSESIESDALKETLKDEGQLEFAGSVLKMEEGDEPIAYTERVFIALEDDASETAAKAVLDELRDDWRIVRRLAYARWCYVIEPKKELGREVFDRAMELVERSAVMRCHPEFLRKRAFRSVLPNQWHNGPRVIGGQLIEQSARVDGAWAFTRGAGTTIAVIDDGVDVNHTEFDRPGKIVAPFDFTLRVPDASPKHPDDNHGTACAGVACAAGIEGAAGVAPDARLMPIRLRSGLGSLDESDAIMWAAQNGADVISCSWGPRDGEWWNPGDPQHMVEAPITDNTALALEAALTSGRMGKGCVICWAAGNGNESVDLDGWASFDGVTAVAACNDRGARSVYSDTGAALACAFPSNDFEFGGNPAPLTPGIWTTDRTGQAGYHANPSPAGDYTATFGGTSSACPGAAGAAALLVAADPMMTGAEVRKALLDTADKIDAAGGAYTSEGHSTLYGYGRLDVEAAVRQVMGF